MPTYEYRCPDGHEFEHFVLKMSQAAAELPCPTCGKLAARFISAGAGLVFKGSGFYITDYGKDGKKDQRERVGAAGATSAKSEAAKSEGAQAEGTKAEGAKGDAVKGEGAKGEAAKGEGAEGKGAKGEAAKGEGAKGEAAKGAQNATAPTTPRKGREE